MMTCANTGRPLLDAQVQAEVVHVHGDLTENQPAVAHLNVDAQNLLHLLGEFLRLEHVPERRRFVLGAVRDFRQHVRR